MLRCRSPLGRALTRQTVLVVADDFIWRPRIEHRQLVDPLENVFELTQKMWLPR